MGFHAGKLDTEGSKIVTDAPIEILLLQGGSDPTIVGRAEFLVRICLTRLFRRFTVSLPAKILWGIQFTCSSIRTEEHELLRLENHPTIESLCQDLRCSPQSFFRRKLGLQSENLEKYGPDIT